MSDMNKGFRLSLTQKDVLNCLALFEFSDKRGPIPQAVLMDMVNCIRPEGKQVHRQNFRVSCKTLVERGWLDQYRSKQFRLAFTLTDLSRSKAIEIMNQRA